MRTAATNVIRKAGIEDAEIVYDLLRHAFGETYLGYTVYQAPESLSYLRKQIANGAARAGQLYFVVLFQDAVAGFYNAAHKANVCLLNYIATHARFRGQGIGGALLEHFETLGRQLACNTLALDVFESNAQVRDWYLRKGYAEDSAHYLVSISMGSVPAGRDVLTFDAASWRNVQAEEKAQGFSKMEVRCGDGSVTLGMINRRLGKLLGFTNLTSEHAIRIARQVLPEREELVLTTDQVPSAYEVLRVERLLRLTKKVTDT